MRAPLPSRHALLAIALVAVAGWWGHDRASPGEDTVQETGPRARDLGPGLADARGAMHARGATIPVPAPRATDEVVISGKVIDEGTTHPVPDVEVVYRSAAGEETTTTGPDGTYRIQLRAGIYRAFVRDDSVLSVGHADTMRLPGLPSPETAGVPDEALMPLVLASADSEDVDLPVTRGGTVHGKVVDRTGRPIAGVVLAARSGPIRPTLGTDVAESDANGEFDLQLPAGEYQIVATHARYAGVSKEKLITIEPGDKATTEVVMTAGCVIVGRVVDAAGHASGDGAIEQQYGSTFEEFSPAGRIESDGTFRWVTTDEATVALRAWPWKAPPSEAKTFACREGARFENVVFELPNQQPDLDGMLVDEHGQPVPFAYLDIGALDEGRSGQQERTDAQGRWQVFSMPAGSYAITAQSPEHGVVHATVTSPAHDVKLALGGTGRIEGTAAQLANGSFELYSGTCLAEGADDSVPLPEQHRLVTVTGGHFTIDGVPACDLVGEATWRDQTLPFRVTVPAGGIAQLALDLGPPRAKHVHGVVRDASHRPVAHAEVTASQGTQETTVTTDAVGRYAIETFSGAGLVATSADSSGFAEVGMGNVDDEEVDFELSPIPPTEDDIDDPSVE
jgi:hypothetical protein